MAEETFDPTESLGPEFGGINQPGTDPQSYQPFEGEPLSFPEAPKFLPSRTDLTLPQSNVKGLVKSGGKNMKKEDISDGIRNWINGKMQETPMKDSAKLFAYNAGPTGNAFYKRYAAFGDKKFGEIGFTPFRDNDAIYNENTTWGQRFSRMMSHSFMPLYGAGFTSGPKSLMKMLQGDFSSNTDEALLYQEAVAIGQDTKGGFGSFFNNTAMNFAYTAGIITEALAEEAVGFLLAAPTGGSSLAATSANVGRNLFRGIKGISHIADMTKAMRASLKMVDNAQGARNFFKAATSNTGRFFNPLENITDAAYDIYKNENNLQGLARLSAGVNKTAGAFYRDVRALNMALAEARLEGGFVENELYDELYSNYIEEKGFPPNDEKQRGMVAHAKEAGLEAKNWNTALIYASNKIVIPNVVGPRGGLGKFLGSKIDEFAQLKGGKIIRETTEQTLKSGKKIKKPTFTWEQAGFKSTLKSFGRDPLSKSLRGLGGYFKGNFMEGIQENAQEVIADATKKYYLATYENDAVAHHISRRGFYNEAIKDQFSAQGLETFASGFFMGMFAGPLNAAIPGMSKLGTRIFNKERYNEYKAARTEYGKRVVDSLNGLTADDSPIFKSNLFNYAKQVDIANDLSDESTSIKEQQDSTNEALINWVSTAIENDKFDFVIDHLKSFKELTAEEFTEALGFNTVEEGAEKLAKIDSYIAKAESIKKRHKYFDEKFKDDVDLKDFEKGSNEHTSALIYKKALAIAKQKAVYFGQSFDDVNSRMISIMDTIKDRLPKGAEINARDVELLFEGVRTEGLPKTASKLSNEIGLLREEIETLAKSEAPTAKQDIAEKTAKVEALENIESAINNYKDVLNKTTESAKEMSPEEYNEQVEKAERYLEAGYKQYLISLAGLSGNYVFNESIDQSARELVDFYKLSAEKNSLAQWVNFLHDPQNFLDYVNSNNQWLHDAYDNRGEYFENIVDKYYKDIETNALLNHLADSGVYISPEDLNAFLTDGSLPKEFYVEDKKIIVDERHPDYPVYLSIFVQALQLQAKDEQALPEKLQKEYDRLDAEMQEEIDALPKVEQKKTLDPIEKAKGKKLNVKYINTQLEDGDYAEATYTEDGEEIVNTFYKDGDVLKHGDKDGNPVDLKLKQKFEKVDKYRMEMVPDPEQEAEIRERYDELKKVAYDDFMAESAQAEKFVPNIIPSTAPVDTLPPELLSQVQAKLDELKESDPEQYGEMDLQTFFTETLEGADLREAWNDEQRALEEVYSQGVVTAPEIKRGNNIIDTTDWGIPEWQQELALREIRFNELSELEELKPKQRAELADLKELIHNIKLYMKYKQVSTRPEAMQKSIDAIKKLQGMQSAVSRTSDERFYIINGKRHNRVTRSYEGIKSSEYTYNQAAKDKIAALWNDRKSVDDFITRLKKLKDLPGFGELTYNLLAADVLEIDMRQKLVSDPSHDRTKEEIKKIKEELKAVEDAGEVTTEEFQKLEQDAQLKIKELSRTLPLTDKQAVDALLDAVTNYTYEESRVGGNEIDNEAKTYFDDLTYEPEFNPDTMTEEAFKGLFGPQGVLKLLRDKVNRGEYHIASKDLVVWDSTASTKNKDGKVEQTGVAGEIDLILVDREGNIMIVDIKTGKTTKWNGFRTNSEFSKITLEEYRLQQSAYANLLYNMLGIDASINLLPIETKMDQNTGKVLKASTVSISDQADVLPADLNGVIFNLEYDERIEEIIPRKAPVDKEDVILRDLPAEVQEPLTEEEIQDLDTEVPNIEQSISSMAELILNQLEDQLQWEESLIAAGMGNPEIVHGLKKQIEDLKKGVEPTELKAIQQRRLKDKQAPVSVTQVDQYERLPSFKDMEGKQVMFNGKAYILKKVERKRKKSKYILQSHVDIIELDASPWQSIEEYSLDLPNRVAQQQASKYSTEYLTEDDIIINDVRYKVRTNEIGNVIGLSPSNKPEQIITNKAMLIAADIERARYNYDDVEDLMDVTEDDIKEELNKLQQDAAYSHLAGVFQNMDSIVNQAVEKLHKRKPLTDSETLRVDLFLTDAIVRVRNLYGRNPLEIYGNVLDTFEKLQFLLYTNNPNFYEQGREEATTDELAERSKSITQGEGPIQEEVEEVIDEDIAEKQMTFEENTPLIDAANTPQEIDEALAEISSRMLAKKISRETTNRLEEYAEERRSKLSRGEGVQLAQNNIKVGDELIVKKPILAGKKQKEAAGILDTVRVVKITDNKITLKKGRGRNFTVPTDQINEYLTSELLEELKEKQQTVLDAEDREHIKNGIDVYSDYLNEKLSLEEAEKSAVDSTYKDLKDNLLDNLDC